VLFTVLNFTVERLQWKVNSEATMQPDSFEDLLAWQKAKVLCVSVYKAFESSSDFGLKDEIQRAALSLMNNISEGFERKTPKEFVAFLYSAKGACGELRSMLLLSKELHKLPLHTITMMNKLAEEISKLITGLILSIQHPNAVLAEVKSLKWEVESLKIKVHTGDWV
jgi:four helix bundle protein